MKKIRSFVALFLAAIILMSFSGCSLRISSFDNLIRPPKLTGKYQGLQDAFDKSVENSFNLITPENGTYQSAFITYDIDGDGIEEAIVFYTDKENADTAKFYYFKYENDTWKAVKYFEGLGNSVDRVIFSDLNQDGKFEMIIGWSLYSSKTNKVFVIYEPNKDGLAIYPSSQYTSIDLIDVNGDGFDDIFTLTVDSSIPDRPAAFARAYDFSSDQAELRLLSEARIDGNISAYSSITVEKQDDKNLIYIEANKGEHEMITEIVYWNDDTNSFVAPLFDVSSQTTKLTWRNNTAVSYDIDEDKLLEIPTSVEMEGALISDTKTDNSMIVKSNSVDNVVDKFYYTKWVKFRDDKLVPVQYSIINGYFGYMLNIQSSWVGRITIESTNGQWDFYRWDSSTFTRGDLLFSIFGYEKTDVQSRDKYKDYKQLNSSGKIAFVYSVSEEGYNFGVKDKTIEKGFIITDFGGKK